MIRLRLNLLRNRGWTGWLLAATLLLKLLVPAGYMPAVSNGALTIAPCTGYDVRAMPMAMPDMKHAPGNDDHHGKVEMPCAFAGLAAPVLSCADPILLGASIAFVAATALRSVPARLVSSPAYLHPPSRGPPATA